MAAVAGNKAATATLVASTADTVTMAHQGRNGVEIVNHGTDVIYYRTDGVAAVEAADENGVVLGGERLYIGGGGDDATISLISAGTPTYTVIVLS